MSSQSAGNSEEELRLAARAAARSTFATPFSGSSIGSGTVELPAAVPATVIKTETIGHAFSSISSAERFALATVGGVVDALSDVVPKRRRADSAGPARAGLRQRSRSPARASLDATMALPVSPSYNGSEDGVAGFRTPGTPAGAEPSLVRSDIVGISAAITNDIMAQMRQLLISNNAVLSAAAVSSVAPAVQAAVAPLEAKLSELVQRVEYIEKNNQGQHQGQRGDWEDWAASGWEDRGPQPGDRDDDFPPLQGSWAERLVKGGHNKGGKPPGKPQGKLAASAGKGGAKGIPGTSRPHAASPSKLHITTLAGARVRLENITEVIRVFLSEGGAAPEYRINGGKFGKSYIVEFKGGAEVGGPLVRAALSSLRRPDGTFRRLTCPAPVDGEPAVALFLNPEQDATKKANDWHFRCLERSVQAIRPDEGYLCDSRDLLISLRWRAIVQLAWDWNKSTYKVAWFEAGAGDIFSAEDRTAIEKGYFDAVSPPGGG
jgi:hypothetical protein